MSEQTVIALGFFDGVHIGHGALLRRTAERARALNAVPAAFTFDRAPKEFVTGVPVPLLTTVDERRALIRELYGIEKVVVAPFDRAMMTTPWEAFLEALTARRGAIHLVAGHDYRFGYKNEGTPERLHTWCGARGVGCDIMEKVELDGVTVSSTQIRALVEEGDMERAAAFLGHPYAISGTVAHGDGLGTAELFPTVNLVPGANRVLPKNGVYATKVALPDGRTYAGVTNVGVRPTVSAEGKVTVETYLAGFEGDLYGARVCVAFTRFLRGERKFESPRALRAQIARDVDDACAQDR